jgi:hypothetical protein
MTVAEKIKQSEDTTLFTLYREGIFYKCYNEDAMVFVQKVKDYKLISKFVKNVGAKVHSIGFPKSEIEKGNLTFESISEKIGAKSYGVKDENIVFLLNDMNTKNDYEAWKKTIQEGIIGRVKKQAMLYQQSTYADVIISMIKNFDLANSTPMQGLGFIQDLQFEVHRLEKNNGII